MGNIVGAGDRGRESLQSRSYMATQVAYGAHYESSAYSDKTATPSDKSATFSGERLPRVAADAGGCRHGWSLNVSPP